MAKITVDKDFLKKVLNKVDSTAALVKDIDQRLVDLETHHHSYRIGFKEPLTRQEHAVRASVVAKDISSLMKKHGITTLELSIGL